MCEIFIIIHILNFYLKYFPSRGNEQEEKTLKKEPRSITHMVIIPFRDNS